MVVSCGLLLPPEQEKTAIKLSSYIAQKSGTASIYKTNLPYVSLYETVFPRRNIEKIKKVIKIIAENIEDNKNNVTKFVVIKPEIQEKGDITSIALYGHQDRPGLLYDTLGIFAKRKINLTRIESRPAKSRLGDYIFYIDFEGELKDPKIKEVLEEVTKQSFKIKTFGTYQEIR